MKSCLVALTLLLLSAPVAAQTIEVGTADWKRLPRLDIGEPRLSYPAMVTAVEHMLRQKQCSLPGQRPAAFDITVPYAVLLQPDGKVSRVVVAEMQCEPLETLVGEVAIQLGERGDLSSAQAAKPGWYASELNFTLQ